MNTDNKAGLIIAIIGLVLLGVSFLGMGNGWFLNLIQPIGPINDPAAAIAGLLGFVLIFIGAKIMRDGVK